MLLASHLPKLPSGWSYQRLGDLVESDRGISYGIVQPGRATPGGTPIVRVNDIRGGKIELVHPLRVQDEVAASYTRTRLRGGELLLTLVGTVGESAVVPPELAGWNTARAVAVVPVRREVGAYWVHLCLRTPPLQHAVEVLCTTTVQATLNLKELAELPIPMPPEPVRTRIETIVRCLDDKLELNRAVNRTLDAIAHGWFKSWFLNFDPVVAKAGGREQRWAAGGAAALFPDRFVESPAGPIPAGWAPVPFSEVVAIHGGGTPKTTVPEYWGGSIPWFSVVDCPDPADVFVLETQKTITERGLAESAAELLGVGTTIITARGTVGQIALVGRPMAMNQSCYGLKGKGGFGPFLVYYATRELADELRQRSHGTVFDTITRATLEGVQIVAPTPDIALAFENLVAPLLACVKANLDECQTLAQLRNLLLPRLISGELRIGHAELLAEQAV